MTGTTARRWDGPDIARGLALIMMALAHTAPSDGPARVLMTTEFLTAPLFAMLVGVGTQLAYSSGRGGVIPTCIRAAVLIAVGWLLAQSAAQIVVVLVPLGVLTLLCLGLERVSNRLLVPTAALCVVATPFLSGAHEHLVSNGMQPGQGTQPGNAVLAALIGALGGEGPYRISAFLAYAAVGIVLTRWILASNPSSMRLGIPAAALLLVMLGLLVGSNLLGIGVHAYDGSLLETSGNLAGAAGIVLACMAVGAGLTSRWSSSARGAMRALGAMSLSVYTLQTVILHGVAVSHPGQRDDSWAVAVLLIVASLALALGWYLCVARSGRSRHSFTRGPLEGISVALGAIAEGRITRPEHVNSSE